jgi:hypothetical protein
VSSRDLTAAEEFLRTMNKGIFAAKVEMIEAIRKQGEASIEKAQTLLRVKDRIANSILKSEGKPASEARLDREAASSADYVEAMKYELDTIASARKAEALHEKMLREYELEKLIYELGNKE